MAGVSRIGGISLLIMLIAAIICGAPSLVYPFGRDQGTFALVGNLVLKGAVPYRDVWDVKPPAVFYVYALAEALFGHSLFAVRLLDIAWQTATMFFVYLIARRLSQREAPCVIAAVIYVAAYWSQGFWNTAQADGFLTLPLAAAVWLVLAPPGKTAVSLAAGALVGLAFWLKYPAGLMLPILCIAAAVTPAPEAIRRPLWIAAGFFLALSAYLAYLAAAGALRDFLSIQFSFLPHYRKILSTSVRGPRGPFFFLRLRDLFGTYFIYPPLLLTALGSYLATIRKKERARARHLVALWALAGLAGLYLQGKFYIYHFAPLIAPLSIGAGGAIGFVIDRKAARRARALALLGILVVCALSSSYSNPRYRRYCFDVYRKSWHAVARRIARGTTPEGYYMNVRFTSDDFSFPADRAVSDYLRRHSRPDEAIYVWGFEPIIYWLADRRSPSRFIHNFPLRGSWSAPGYARELIEELKRDPPAYFIVMRGDPMPWMVGSEEDSARALSRQPALSGWLEENYAPETRIEDFVIYRRRTP